MTFEALGAATVLLLLAAVAARLTREHVPHLVTYLIVGALLGPTGIGLIDRPSMHALEPVTIVPLAVLMFITGERVSIRALRAARWLTVVAPVSFLCTAVLVWFCTRVAGASVTLAAVLAVLAGGGAPMTVAAVFNSEPTETRYGKALISLHVSCDALAVLSFAVVFPLAYLAATGSNIGASLGSDIVKLGVAGLLLGAALGTTLSYLCRRLPSRRAVVAVTAAHILAAALISDAVGFSVPLAALVMGAVVTTCTPEGTSAELLSSLRPLTPGLYLVFFALAGAAIRINELPALGLVGAAYVSSRAGGKLLGALIGGATAGLSRRESLRVGLGSLPHAGVSVGLAAIASTALPGRGLVTIPLSGIVVFELAGALIVRNQLRRYPFLPRLPGRLPVADEPA